MRGSLDSTQVSSPTIPQLRTALESSPTGALVVDGDGHIVLANKKVEELFQYDPGELVGVSVDTLVPRDARPDHAELRGAFLDYPKSRMMGTGRDLHGVAKTGKLIPVEIGLNPIETVDGLVVMCTVLDITERKRQQERFNVALDAAPSAILMLDRHGTIVLCNRLVETVFGYPREDLIGQTVEKLIPATMRRRHAVYRSGYVASPTPRAMGANKKLRGLHSSGHEFPVEVGLQPVSMPDGDYVIASVVDISDRVAADDEIQRKNAELTMRNDEIRTFAYSVSHDLKGPLATIDGLSQHLIEDLKNAGLDDALDCAGQIQRLASRTANLVEDVLGLAQSEDACHPRSTVAIRACVEEVCGEFEALRAEHDVAITVDIPADQALMTERPRFKSIVSNLISNAIKYSDPDKPERRIHVTAQLDHAFELRVRDNGLGIPADMVERVFQMFQRAHAVSTPGNGLGLTLVKRHASRLGGSIDLNADDDTEFSLRLPLLPPSEASHETRHHR